MKLLTFKTIGCSILGQDYHSKVVRFIDMNIFHICYN